MSITNFRDANPRRGVKHEHHAVIFARTYPIGSTLTNEEFDRWAESQNLLALPSPSTGKKSDEWLAHLQRRHQIKNGINTSLAHPRMNAISGVGACTITRVGHGLMEVQSVTDAVVRSRLPKAVQTLTDTHRRRLIHLQQSADWNALPPYEKVRVEEIAANIDDFASRLDYEVLSINKRITRLHDHLRVAVSQGQLATTDGAIPALMAPIPDGGDPVPDEEDDTGN